MGRCAPGATAPAKEQLSRFRTFRADLVPSVDTQNPAIDGH